MYLQYSDINEDQARSIRDSGIVGLLLITATQIEKETVHRYMTPLQGHNSLLCTRTEFDTYFVGQFGVYGAVHIQCSAGSTGRFGAHLTTMAAIHHWQPFFIVMPGIAFGRDPKKQKMGDILISEAIDPYGLVKIQDQFPSLPDFFDYILPPKIIDRGKHIPAGPILFNRFTNVVNWHWTHSDIGTPNLKNGVVVSGDELISSRRRKRTLFKSRPEAIGGEMEGAGVSAAASRCNKEWIIVKSICDWGDKHKDDKYQKIAAEASTALCHHVFSSPNAFPRLKAFQIIQNSNDGGIFTKFEVVNEDKPAEDKKNIVNSRLKRMWTAIEKVRSTLESSKFSDLISPKARQILLFGMCEIIDNGFTHGNAANCEISVKDSSITISLDGKPFDPGKESVLAIGNDSYGGGLFTIHKMLNDFLNEFSYSYQFDERILRNIIVFSFAKGSVRQESVLELNARDLIEGQLHFFLGDIPSGYKKIVLDISKDMKMISFSSHLVLQVLDLIPASVMLEVKVAEDDSYVYEFLMRMKVRREIKNLEISFRGIVY
ncbi:MAG: hypothetical protein JNL11_03300 [Bdellovibrionaceae bacterium]|nr:hypothetical protein [Pseudobdellovibrionaceae bacterium]